VEDRTLCMIDSVF